MCRDCDGSGKARSSEKDTVPDGNYTLRKSCRQRSRPPAGAKTVPSFSTAESSAMESREPAQSSSNAASTLGQAVEATMTSNMLKVFKRYKLGTVKGDGEEREGPGSPPSQPGMS